MNRNVIVKLVGWASLAMIAVLALMMFSPRPLYAQVDTGAILGTVSDTSGAAIHGATVTLTNQGTGAALTTTTESDGSYKFTPVRIGNYKLSATFAGFQTMTQTDVSVNIGQNVRRQFLHEARQGHGNH